MVVAAVAVAVDTAVAAEAATVVVEAAEAATVAAEAAEAATVVVTTEAVVRITVNFQSLRQRLFTRSPGSFLPGLFPAVISFGWEINLG